LKVGIHHLQVDGESRRWWRRRGAPMRRRVWRAAGAVVDTKWRPLYHRRNSNEHRPGVNI